jgi:hypothetical protein
MYKPEIHRTISKVQLLERLSLNLNITDNTYQSNHSIDGLIRVFDQPDDRVIADRKYPPMHPVSALADITKSESSSSHLGTRLYLGIARNLPLEQDENEFQNDYVSSACNIGGIPEDGVINFDLDWNPVEAEELIADDTERVQKEKYEIIDLPSEQLPIIIRAEIYRDAKQILQVVQTEDGNDHGDFRGRQKYEGLAALVLDIEYRSQSTDESTGEASPLQIKQLQVEMSQTFPEIEFSPQHGSTYDPQSQHINWGGTRSVDPGDTKRYAIIGPISQLLDTDRLTAHMRGELGNYSLSGIRIAELFDESGRPTRDWSKPSPKVSEKTRITADIEIDPAALRGNSKQVSNSKISLQTTPTSLFNELIKLCDRNGMNITERSPPDDGVPIEGRQGVYDVSGDNAGELDVRREYGDNGVVYAGMEVTGRYTAMSEEKQISTFDETEDRLVRRTGGGLDDAGKAVVEINARSADSSLNSRFLSTVEEALKGEI